MPCFYSISADDEFIFEKHGRTVYGFGCNGRGFKHMTYHGKRVYHLLEGNQKEADKYKKSAIIDANTKTTTHAV
jgi:glycine/D-amino acid oxidase-like deaminating enzyme